MQSPTKMEATKCSSDVCFMDIVNNPVCSKILYAHLDSVSRANLRLVSKELRDAVDLNVRGLSLASQEEDNGDYEPVNMPGLVSKLPNLESIYSDWSFRSPDLLSIVQGAKLARKLIRLELEREEDEDKKEMGPAELFQESLTTISHSHWPSLQTLDLRIPKVTVSVDAMKGLLLLSTLTRLDVFDCTFNNESLALIQPGSWPCLRDLDLDGQLEDPVFTIRALLHLTGLEELWLEGRRISGKAIAQIQPGSWPQLKKLRMDFNNFSDDPVGAVKGLLCLTTLNLLQLDKCRLNGMAVGQIKPGDWPCMQILSINSNKLGDDPVGAMKGLLHLQIVKLYLEFCDLSGEAVSQIKAGDWPQLERLSLRENSLGDDPVGAMKGLLHLSSLTDLSLAGCHLNGTALSQIKAGDWPQLVDLFLFFNNLDDDPVGAMKGLLHLSSLCILFVGACHLNGMALGQIKPGDWPCMHALFLNSNKLGDDPVGAMKGLLHLSSLARIALAGCHLNGMAFSQIKPGDWPRLKVLSLEDDVYKIVIDVKDYSDDPVGAMTGLRNLPPEPLYNNKALYSSDLSKFQHALIKEFVENNPPDELDEFSFDSDEG